MLDDRLVDLLGTDPAAWILASDEPFARLALRAAMGSPDDPDAEEATPESRHRAP